jgi:hypothetical protein
MAHRRSNWLAELYRREPARFATALNSVLWFATVLIPWSTTEQRVAAAGVATALTALLGEDTRSRVKPVVKTEPKADHGER